MGGHDAGGVAVDSAEGHRLHGEQVHDREEQHQLGHDPSRLRDVTAGELKEEGRGVWVSIYSGKKGTYLRCQRAARAEKRKSGSGLEA